MSEESQSIFDPFLNIKHEPEETIIDVNDDSDDHDFDSFNTDLTQKCFDCSVCGAEQLSKTSFAYHKKKHAGLIMPPRKVHCNMCNRLVTSLSIHQATFHSSVTYKCDLCNFTTKYPTNIAAHKNSKHSTTKLYVCSHCNKKYSDRSNRNRHMRISHQSTPIKFVCHICPMEVTFSRSDNLTLHLKRIHGIVASKVAANVLHCDHCIATFKTKPSLIKHLRNVHFQRAREIFKCSVCNQEFFLQESLINHLNAIHLKKYCCHHCCKILGNRNTLLKHEASGKCQRKIKLES